MLVITEQQKRIHLKKKKQCYANVMICQQSIFPTNLRHGAYSEVVQAGDELTQTWLQAGSISLDVLMRNFL